MSNPCTNTHSRPASTSLPKTFPQKPTYDRIANTSQYQNQCPKSIYEANSRDRANQISARFKNSQTLYTPRTNLAANEAPKILTRHAPGDITNILNVQNLTDLGGVEICIKETLCNLYEGAPKDKELISIIKEDFKEYFISHHSEHLVCLREKNENLIVYLKTKELENQMLETKQKSYPNLGINLFYRPLIAEGEIDFRHYKVKINLDYRLATDIALAYLENTWSIIYFEIGSPKYGDDGVVKALVKFKSQEEIEQLGMHIEIFGYRCAISHQLLYTCKLCQERGHWEDRCSFIKENKLKAMKLQKEIENIQRKRSIITQQYHCLIQANRNPFDCLITNVYRTKNSLFFTFHREKCEPRQGNITCEEKTEEKAFLDFLCQQSIQNFAIASKEDNGTLKNIEKYQITNVKKAIESSRNKTEEIKTKLTQQTLDNYLMDIDKSPETLKIVHLNICGLKNKINETRNFVIRENIDILGLSETHLKIEESAPHISNYTTDGNNYSSNSKGVGFYIRNKIRKQEMFQVPTNFKEKERIAIMKLENLTLIEIYAPVESDTENNRKEFYLALSEITAELQLTTNNLIVMGDFNAHIKGHESENTNSNGKLMKNYTKENGLEILNLPSYTFLGRHGRPTCIDYFTMPRHLKEKITICGPIYESLGSDHVPIFIELIPPLKENTTQKIRKIYRTEQLKDPKIIAKYQMRIEELYEAATKHNDPNQMYKTIVDILDQAATETIGIKTPQNTRRNPLNVETRIAVNRARIPYSRAIQEARSGNIDEYIELM